MVSGTDGHPFKEVPCAEYVPALLMVILLPDLPEDHSTTLFAVSVIASPSHKSELSELM
jgi:hypothetical protein